MHASLEHKVAGLRDYTWSNISLCRRTASISSSIESGIWLWARCSTKTRCQWRSGAAFRRMAAKDRLGPCQTRPLTTMPPTSLIRMHLNLEASSFEVFHYLTTSREFQQLGSLTLTRAFPCHIQGHVDRSSCTRAVDLSSEPPQGA